MMFFMDNKYLGGMPGGIKQILERKEGLFRSNMMGKRVNFCCRSVISPDPYMGTNEVGIPVKFAKELHYPTPVSTWNIKLMRELVERGPHEYPGEYAIISIMYKSYMYVCMYICMYVCMCALYSELLDAMQCDDDNFF